MEWYTTMMTLDYKEIERLLSEMQPRQVLFQLVKKEMQKRSHWKGQPRGKMIREVLDNRTINVPGSHQGADPPRGSS